MGSPSDTSLTGQLRVNLSLVHRKIDLALNTPLDSINYGGISHTFQNGAGNDKLQLLYHKRRRLINSTEVFNLDGGLTNIWGDALDFDAVKILVIKNLETAINRFLEVRFKNEAYYIGPTGSRLVVEPYGGGIEAIVSSASSEEGQLVISSNADITYDIILAGSATESSSSSGV